MLQLAYRRRGFWFTDPRHNRPPADPANNGQNILQLLAGPARACAAGIGTAPNQIDVDGEVTFDPVESIAGATIQMRRAIRLEGPPLTSANGEDRAARSAAPGGYIHR